MSENFIATLLGSALGVVAGAFIQYLATIWIERHNRRNHLSDLKIEGQYNLKIAEDMLEQTRRLRAAAQPATYANFIWVSRAGNALSVALSRIIASGELYKMFTMNEILQIQRLVQFFTVQFDQFITDKIKQTQDSGDIPEAHRFADYLEAEVTDKISIIKQLLAK